MIPIISQHWEGAGHWISGSRMTTSHLTHTVNTMFVDHMTELWVKALAALVLTKFSQNIPAETPEGFRGKPLFRDRSWNNGMHSLSCYVTRYSMDNWLLAKVISFIVFFIILSIPYPLVCTLHYFITIMKQTCLKALNIWKACMVYSVQCLRLNLFFQLSFMQFMGLWIISLPISL